MERNSRKVQDRGESFTRRTVTRLWEETSSAQNPYIASSCRCFGYDLFELMEKRSFVDVLLLLFRGELPSREHANLLENLMIGMINPGPRHPATRAAMNAGVGKTDVVHILPISLGILGGNHLGASAIEDAMRFLRKQCKKAPEAVIDSLVDERQRPVEGDWHPLPGFGSRFGGIDEIPRKLALHFSSLPGAGKSLEWGCRLADGLQPLNLGWLTTGIAAAVFSDLGIHPRDGAGLFQLINAPGLLAHGLEMANKPITAMPFPSDEEYEIEEG